MTSRPPSSKDLARMPLGSPPLGSAVRGRFTKWGGGRHWEWEGTFLGEDEHGRWFYASVGTHCARPGVEMLAERPWVSLAPHDGAWAAGFYPTDDKTDDKTDDRIAVYVDMTTVPQWSEIGDGAWEVTMVDLDLDVVLTGDGHLYVDDEDEFAEHQISLEYPPDIVDLAELTARAVFAAIASGAEPFLTVGHRHLFEAEAGLPFAGSGAHPKDFTA